MLSFRFLLHLLICPRVGVTKEAYEIYSELAKGGVGTIITGFISVALHDYYFDGMMRLCDDALIPQYQKLVDVIHAESIPVVTQLALGAFYREGNGRYIQVEPDLPNKMLENPCTVSKCVACNRCYSSPAHKCIFSGRERS